MNKKLQTLNKIIYWVLTLTWGFLMSIVSCFVFLYEIMGGNKPHIKGGEVGFYVEGDYGFNVGWCYVTCSKDIEAHEIGHGLQNAIYGVFAPFIVYIPSFIRYWKRELKTHIWEDYNNAWFEKQATSWGKSWCDKIE